MFRFYGALHAKGATCRDPGLNQGPSDLQSDALPTELSRHYFFHRSSLSKYEKRITISFHDFVTEGTLRLGFAVSTYVEP